MLIHLRSRKSPGASFASQFNPSEKLGPGDEAISGIRIRIQEFTMTSIFRLTRQIRPIQSVLRQHYSSKPPSSSHSPVTGEKLIADTDQTTTHVPARTQHPEGHAPVPADIVSGAPEDLHRRTVRIYKPAKSAMQSGLHGNLYWRLDWDVKPDDNRWEHPVMFWAARFVSYKALLIFSGDYMQGTRMNFNTKEDAIAFAE